MIGGQTSQSYDGYQNSYDQQYQQNGYEYQQNSYSTSQTFPQSATPTPPPPPISQPSGHVQTSSGHVGLPPPSPHYASPGHQTSPPHASHAQQEYPPQPQGYPPQQQGYPPQQQGYPPQQQGYPPQHQVYPPQHQGYPQQQSYAQQDYPPQQQQPQPDYAPYDLPKVGTAPSRFASYTEDQSTSTSSYSGPLDINVIKKLPQNCACADCGAPDPDWCSMNLGIFLCVDCAGIHRSLGVEYSKVRSVNLDTTCWREQDNVLVMANMGNDKSNQKYEARTPHFFLRPKPESEDTPENALIREYWIKAKYQKEEFVPMAPSEQKEPVADGCTFLMPERILEGWLTKQSGQRKNKWQRRWFVLYRDSILYYLKPKVTEQNGKIKLDGASIDVCDSSEESFKFMFSIKTAGREFFIHADDAGQFFTWIHTLRRAIIYYSDPKLHKAHSRAPSYQVLDSLSAEMMQNAVYSGVVVKLGHDRKSWKKRWACLLGDVLYYFRGVNCESDWKTLKDQKPRGSIKLTKASVSDLELPDKPKKHLFRIFTDERLFFLCAESHEKMVEWVSAVRRCIDRCNNTNWVDFKTLSVIQ